MTLHTVMPMIPQVALCPEKYDESMRAYVELVDRELSNPLGFWPATLAVFDKRLRSQLRGKALLDIACGEGFLSRHLHQYGTSSVVGVDISVKMLEVAAERTPYQDIEFRHDNAHTLMSVGDASVDVAVSSMALMDIPDHLAMFQAVRRVLKPGGTFMFSALHPCFEAPFDARQHPQFVLDDSASQQGYVIRHYKNEGQWFSGAANGWRAKVGAYHRTLSTLLNDLLVCGFALQHVEEPVALTPDLFGRVPRVIVIEVRA